MKSEYDELVREVVTSARDLMRSEADLLKTEVQVRLEDMRTDLAHGLLAMGLLVASLLPFLAFVILGLGQVLDGRYWLSSLIVALILAFSGFFYGYPVIKRPGRRWWSLSATRGGLNLIKRNAFGGQKYG